MDYVTRPHALGDLLATISDDIEILSLDCFDTLIWRNVNAPLDVFTELGIPGGGVSIRRHAEGKARRIAPLRHGRPEVTIAEIYDELMPNAGMEDRVAAVDRELEAEARHCYAFAPTCDLIRDAKRRGMKVVIVSDTYLSEPQLRALIATVGGTDLAGMIDQIFCSCEFGIGKAAGLFKPVLQILDVQANAILHVGDNLHADQEAPSALGLHTVHIRQFEDTVEQRLRLEVTAATVMESETRSTIPAYQPHRAQIAMRRESDPAFALGHDILGPVMHGFAEWLRAEAEALSAKAGKPVKLLFLLRDGYLPHLAFLERFPEWQDRCIAVELSRFVATAASFTDTNSVKRYLDENVLATPLTVIAAQMLFTSGESKKLTGNGARQFLSQLRTEASTRKIISRSEKFSRRLCRYLEKQGIEPGDAVMLVDLGYNGSVQNMLEPRLRDAMGLDIAGRYLLLREVTRTGLDKRGYLSVDHYDNRGLRALCESIAIIEQLCTMPQGSVIDYRDDGTPVRKAADIKNTQSAQRDTAQAGCLAYVRDHGARPGMARPPKSSTPDHNRRANAAILARFLTLPLAEETEILRDFYHDVNLGTKAVEQLLDPVAAQEGMRRRGLFYMKNATRMFLPGELQSQGLQINLTLFGARRFDLDLRKSDFNVGQITLPILISDGSSISNSSIEAHPTADGFYHALIPIGIAQLTIGLQLCKLYEWVQIEEAQFLFVDNFMEHGVRERHVGAAPVYDAMEETAPGLFHCTQPDGIMLIQPPSGRFSEALVLSVVFRPLVTRTASVFSKAA